jgi:hypothetical protein
MRWLKLPRQWFQPPANCKNPYSGRPSPRRTALLLIDRSITNWSWLGRQPVNAAFEALRWRTPLKIAVTMSVIGFGAFTAPHPRMEAELQQRYELVSAPVERRARPPAIGTRGRTLYYIARAAR